MAAGPSKKSNVTASTTAPAIASERMISKQDVSRAMRNVETQLICDKIINLESDKNRMRSSRTSKRNRSILVGSGTNMNTCPFTPAPLLKFNEYHQLTLRWALLKKLWERT